MVWELQDKGCSSRYNAATTTPNSVFAVCFAHPNALRHFTNTQNVIIQIIDGTFVLMGVMICYVSEYLCPTRSPIGRGATPEQEKYFIPECNPGTRVNPTFRRLYRNPDKSKIFLLNLLKVLSSPLLQYSIHRIN